MIQYLGLILLALFAANAWAWLSVLSSRAGLPAKIAWAAILPVPLFGWLAWYLTGPRDG